MIHPSARQGHDGGGMLHPSAADPLSEAVAFGALARRLSKDPSRPLTVRLQHALTLVFFAIDAQDPQAAKAMLQPWISALIREGR